MQLFPGFPQAIGKELLASGIRIACKLGIKSGCGMRKSNNKPLKILVVEDDPDILNALNIALGSVGFDVDVLLTGKAILQNQFVVPDLFILDKRLPDVDGLEICRYLKSKPSYQGVPIIVISASPKVKNNALESGASVFIEKPFAIRELVDAIMTTLKIIPAHQ
jgi:DNA-binding response OmpR family regulator